MMKPEIWAMKLAYAVASSRVWNTLPPDIYMMLMSFRFVMWFGYIAVLWYLLVRTTELTENRIAVKPRPLAFLHEFCPMRLGEVLPLLAISLEQFDEACLVGLAK